MTALEFRAALAHLGMQQNWLASELGVSAQAVNRWARGTLKVPQYVEAYLGLLLHPNKRDEMLANARWHTETFSKGRMQRLAEATAKRKLTRPPA